MRGTAEVIKGRVEEAAGALANNDKLRVKGKADQAVGHVRQAAEGGVQNAKEKALHIVDEAKSVAKKMVDKVRHK